jgi:hypothetical protein
MKESKQLSTDTSRNVPKETSEASVSNKSNKDDLGGKETRDQQEGQMDNGALGGNFKKEEKQ